MTKLLADLDREALERIRVKLGARSQAEALRRLIKDADPQRAQTARAAAIERIMDPLPPGVAAPKRTQPTTSTKRIRGYASDGSPIYA